MKVTFVIDRIAVFWGTFFNGAAMGAVVGLELNYSPTLLGAGCGVLWLLLLLKPFSKWFHWGFVGLVGIASAGLLAVVLFCVSGDILGTITSLAIVSIPLVVFEAIGHVVRR